VITLVIVWIIGRPEQDSNRESDATAPPVAPTRPASPGGSYSPGPISGAGRNLTGTVKDRKPYDTGIKDDPRVQHTEDGKHIFVEATSIARQLHDRENAPEQDLADLNEIMTFYRMVFRENPVASDNQSVMAALMGENSRDIVLFPADHPALNEDGKLLDRWNAPYYFHPLSGTVMEIISLGPDQELGSDDDLIFTPRDERDFFRRVTGRPDYGIEE
jgi:hypothetical protein